MACNKPRNKGDIVTKSDIVTEIDIVTKSDIVTERDSVTKRDIATKGDIVTKRDIVLEMKQTKKFCINTLNFGLKFSYSNLTCNGRTIAGGGLVE